MPRKNKFTQLEVNRPKEGGVGFLWLLVGDMIEKLICPLENTRLKTLYPIEIALKLGPLIFEIDCASNGWDHIVVGAPLVQQTQEIYNNIPIQVTIMYHI